MGALCWGPSFRHRALGARSVQPTEIWRCSSLFESSQRCSCRESLQIVAAFLFVC